MSDIRLQEILTRAVVGRGDHRVLWSHASPAEGVEGVLGVHVSSARLSVEHRNGETTLRLRVSSDVWCNCGDETRILRVSATHSERADIRTRGTVVGELDVTASLVRPVRCTRTEIAGDEVILQLEAEVALEAIALARFWVRAYDLELSDDLQSGDTIGDSSSSSSSTSTSDLVFSGGPDVELMSGDIADVVGLLGADEPEELAELPPAEPVAPSEPRSPKPARDVTPGRTATVLSQFQHTVGSSRISIVQGF